MVLSTRALPSVTGFKEGPESDYIHESSGFSTQIRIRYDTRLRCQASISLSTCGSHQDFLNPSLSPQQEVGYHLYRRHTQLDLKGQHGI